MRSIHITRTAATFVALAIAAPAAQAMPARDGGPYDASAPVPQTTSPAVKQVDTGFDWGSAALGAGGGALVVTLLGAGSLTLTRGSRVGRLAA